MAKRITEALILQVKMVTQVLLVVAAAGQAAVANGPVILVRIVTSMGHPTRVWLLLVNILG